MNAPALRFDAATHTYHDTGRGVTVPHITGLLERAGWIDSTWFTEESSARGQAVHTLTAAYDMGALTLEDSDAGGGYRGWILGHAAVMRIMSPQWIAIEVPRIHAVHKFGGRPDRVGFVRKLAAVWEIKSGGPEKSHPIQTALQAILVAGDLNLPAHAIARYAEYVNARGRFHVERHTDRSDFDEAYEILRRFAAR